MICRLLNTALSVMHLRCCESCAVSLKWLVNISGVGVEVDVQPARRNGADRASTLVAMAFMMHQLYRSGTENYMPHITNLIRLNTKVSCMV